MMSAFLGSSVRSIEPLVELDGGSYAGDSFVWREFRQSVQSSVIPLADILCYSPGTNVESNTSFRILAAAAFNLR
jgi:hypothetical protein